MAETPDKNPRTPEYTRRKALENPPPPERHWTDLGYPIGVAGMIMGGIGTIVMADDFARHRRYISRDEERSLTEEEKAFTVLVMIALAGLGLTVSSLVAGHKDTKKKSAVREQERIAFDKELEAPVEGASTFNALDPSVRRKLRVAMDNVLHDGVVLTSAPTGNQPFDIGDPANLAKVLEGLAAAFRANMNIIPVKPSGPAL